MGYLINCEGSKKDRAEWWLTFGMLKKNIHQDREDNNLLSLKKEKDLFSYVVNNVRFQPGNRPIRGQLAA